MKPAQHGLSPHCIAVVLCLAVSVGCSAPTDSPAQTSGLGAGAPALSCCTPPTAPSSSQESSQAAASALEAAATVDLSSGVRTPELVFFTPTIDQADRRELPVDAGTPGIAPGSGDGTGTPQLTRVALQVTSSAIATLLPTRVPVAPRATARAQALSASDKGPVAHWPKGWWLVAVAVVAIIPIAWLFTRRRP